MFSNELTYSKGQLLNELFYIQEGWQKYTIETSLEEHKRSGRTFGDDGQMLIFRLLQRPDSTINQPFKFTIMLDDSSEFFLETGVFIVD